MIKKIFGFLLALFLLPACIAVTINIYNQLSRVHNFSKSQTFFIWGLVAYLLFHIIFYKPDRFYILGHESMHALATLLSGGRVKSIKVSKKGGSTTTTKTNTFIYLAPYFFPVYTIIIALAYFLASFFYDISKWTNLFMFLVGCSLSFHLVLTVDFLKVKQPDLVQSGYLVSLFLIYIVNVSIATYILSLIFYDVSFADFLRSSAMTTKDIYTTVFSQLFL